MSNLCYVMNQTNYNKIPGSPIAYWVPLNVFNLFEDKPKLGNLCISKTGMTTGDNNRFLRLWYEVANISINSEWRFYNKGGGYRKWYGNIDYVIIWSNEGKLVRNASCSTIRNLSYYFNKCISWNLITTDKISCRALEPIFVMGDAGPACYINNDNDYYRFLALLNTNTADYLLKIINPTINYSCGVMEVFPVCKEQIDNNAKIISFTQENISLSKTDWDSFETSWDFKKHPLI